MVNDFFLCHWNSTGFLYDVSVVFFKRKWGFNSTMADFFQSNLLYRWDLYGSCSKASWQAQKEDLHHEFYFHLILGKLNPRRLNRGWESWRALGRKETSPIPVIPKPEHEQHLWVTQVRSISKGHPQEKISFQETHFWQPFPYQLSKLSSCQKWIALFDKALELIQAESAAPSGFELLSIIFIYNAFGYHTLLN